MGSVSMHNEKEQQKGERKCEKRASVMALDMARRDLLLNLSLDVLWK